MELVTTEQAQQQPTPVLNSMFLRATEQQAAAEVSLKNITREWERRRRMPGPRL